MVNCYPNYIKHLNFYVFVIIKETREKRNARIIEKECDGAEQGSEK